MRSWQCKIIWSPRALGRRAATKIVNVISPQRPSAAKPQPKLAIPRAKAPRRQRSERRGEEFLQDHSCFSSELGVLCALARVKSSDVQVVLPNGKLAQAVKNIRDFCRGSLRQFYAERKFFAKFHSVCKYYLCRRILHAVGHRLHRNYLHTVGNFCRERPTIAAFGPPTHQHRNSVGF